MAVNTIHRMDAIDGLKALPNESVDLVVTDPPYGIASANKLTIQRGRLVSTMTAWGKWDRFAPGEYDPFIESVLAECFRVLRPGGGLYMFTAREDSGYFTRRAVQLGFTHRNQLAMVRTSPLPSFGKRNWRSGFELCFYVTKGKPATFNFLSQRECNNVFYYHSTFKQTKHPTEKPLEVIKRLVLVSSKPGDLVLDPFMGSGTTAVAAKLSGRRYVGFEREPRYVAMAERRLAAIKATDDAPTGKGAAA